MASTADVARVFLEAAFAQEQGGRLTGKKREQLQRILFVLAVATSDPEYDADLQYPGYVAGELPPYKIYLPFHFARFFPKGEMLQSVAEAALDIALEDENPICVSGSVTFHAGAPCFSDLDFCEYYSSRPHADSAASVVRKIRDAPPELTVAELRYLKSTFAYPETLEVEQLRSLFAGTIDSEARPSLKLETIFLSRGLGVLPASNLVLMVAPDAPEEGAAQRSFTFQEAVLTRRPGPPRTLVDETSLGGYLNFLREQARKYAAGHPIKSLKRSLCFFLLTNVPAPAEAILDVLRSPMVRLMTLADRQSTLDALLDGAPDELGARLESLRPPRIPPDQIAYVEALALAALRDLAEDMFAAIEELYDGLRDGER